MNGGGEEARAWFRWEGMRSELGLVCGWREGRAGRMEPGTPWAVKVGEEGKGEDSTWV